MGIDEWGFFAAQYLTHYAYLSTPGVLEIAILIMSGYIGSD